MNDDYDEPAERPHDAVRVARRSLVLSAAACRGSIDHGAGDPDAESLRERMLEWLGALDLWNEVEPGEQGILHAALGTLDQKAVIRYSWCVEGLAVLAWALGRFDLPAHDEQVDPYAVTDAVWFLSEDARDIVTEATLRSHPELEAYRELMYAIHCRLRVSTHDTEPKNFKKWTERSWLDALQLKPEGVIAGHELSIGGKPIHEAEEDRRRECQSIAFERHRAIIWLFEGHSKYWATPVDT
jgi:hypothetical protein